MLKMQNLYAGRHSRAFFIAVILLFALTRAYAQVYVGGVLTENTIWTKANNPYIVVESVTVPQNITLTIEPGVLVFVKVNQTIRINGTIIARGTTQDSIYFHNEGTKWYGIILDNVNSELDDEQNYYSGSILSHISILNSSFALVMQNNTSVIVDSSNFTNTEYGLYLNQSHSNLIRGNNFSNNDIAIFSSASSGTSNNLISGNKISGCKHVAIFFSNNNGQSINNRLLNNDISDNFIGLFLGSSSPDERVSTQISGNRIHNNAYGLRIAKDSTLIEYNCISHNQFGLDMNGSRYSTISNNIICNNEYLAVSFNSGASFNKLTGNTLIENRKGIQFTGLGEGSSIHNEISHNLFRDNTDSLILISSAPQDLISYNSFINNGDSGRFANYTRDTIFALHNYWGTADTSFINGFIHDIYDNSAKGVVIYKPLDTIPDSDVPISPPQFAYKRVSGNNIIVNWSRNMEADLAGYNVYYGTGLLTRVDAVTDTALLLSGLQITDTIAVTAYDLQADGYLDLYEGHESRFTIAVILPFAGPDTAICAGTDLYLTNVSAINYNELLWTTDGDGTFSNASMLNPVYTPGNADIENGTVLISLTVRGDDFEFSDDLILTIYKFPDINAGNDTTLIINSDIVLTRSQVLNSTSFYWTTPGDGSFDDPLLLHPSFTPGINDSISGFVQLILHAASQCGQTSDTMTISFVPVYRIEGTVFSDEGTMEGSVVTLISQTNPEVKSENELISSTGGKFIFNYLPAGEYLLKAYPPGGSAAELLPAFYYNEILWQNARTITLEENTFDVDIKLPRYQELPLTGMCRLRGVCRIEQNAEICSKVDVFVYDKTLKYILAWQTVAEDGSFLFENLPFGSYVVMAQMSGFSGIPSEVLFLTPEFHEVTDMEIWLSADKRLYFKNIPASGVLAPVIYPNPTGGPVQIISCETISSVAILTSEGITYPGKEFMVKNTGSELTLDLSALPAGMYYLRLDTDNCPQTMYKILLVK